MPVCASRQRGLRWPVALPARCRFSEQLIMFLGKVIGTVVATQKEASLVGLKMLVVRRLTIDGADTSGYVVAADAVGAGLDEIVLVATGSSARQTRMTDKRPCDAVVMAIVDTLEIDGAEKYRKA
jgi:microcompartment protein CcmK/EutM